MSIKLGTTTIAGLNTNKIVAGRFLLEPIWSDHIINDIQFLRADTFSWQSGSVYTYTYNHFVSDIQGKTLQSETISGITIQFYRADDGHKICPASEETNLLNLYNTYGIAYYVLLDSDNTRFKLPRTKFGFEGLRGNVGDDIAESLPNITGKTGYISTGTTTPSGAFYKGNSGTVYNNNSAITGVELQFDASSSSSTYQDNAPVQERATQMYLYFYVGEFSQTAIEQTAGITSEQLNAKLDIPTRYIVSKSDKSILPSWWTIYSDGWCEQGGYIDISASYATISTTFLKSYADNNFSIVLSQSINFDGDTGANAILNSKSTLGFAVKNNDKWQSFYWQASGYLAEGEY